jgi:hypothetical protein
MPKQDGPRGSVFNSYLAEALAFEQHSNPAFWAFFIYEEAAKYPLQPAVDSPLEGESLYES